MSWLLDAGACWSGSKAGMLGDDDHHHDEEERGAAESRAAGNASIKFDEAMSPVGLNLALPWGKSTQANSKGGGAVVNTRAPIRQADAAEASPVGNSGDGDWT